jgi:hypothetical protein
MIDSKMLKQLEVTNEHPNLKQQCLSFMKINDLKQETEENPSAKNDRASERARTKEEKAESMEMEFKEEFRSEKCTFKSRNRASLSVAKFYEVSTMFKLASTRILFC